MKERGLNWLELFLGFWIVVSPWVLGFAGITLALWSNVIAGVLITIAALWELFDAKEKI